MQYRNIKFLQLDILCNSPDGVEENLRIFHNLLPEPFREEFDAMCEENNFEHGDAVALPLGSIDGYTWFFIMDSGPSYPYLGVRRKDKQPFTIPGALEFERECLPKELPIGASTDPLLSGQDDRYDEMIDDFQQTGTHRHWSEYFKL